MQASIRHIGPGIVLAATGLGAGDLIAASVAGARFGYSLLWAMFMPLLAALLLYMKYSSGWMRDYTNSWISNAALLVALGLFATLLLNKLINVLS